MAFSPFQLHRHFPSSCPSDGEDGEEKSVPTPSPSSSASAQRVVGFSAAHGDPWSPSSVLAAQEPGAKASAAGHHSKQSTLASAIHKDQQVQLQPLPGNKLSIKTKVAGAAGGPALKGLQLRRARSTGQPLVGRDGHASAQDSQAGEAAAAAGERRGAEPQRGATGGLQRAGGRQQTEMTRQRSASIDIPRHVISCRWGQLPGLKVAEGILQKAATCPTGIPDDIVAAAIQAATSHCSSRGSHGGHRSPHANQQQPQLQHQGSGAAGRTASGDVVTSYGSGSVRNIRPPLAPSPPRSAFGFTGPAAGVRQGSGGSARNSAAAATQHGASGSSPRAHSDTVTRVQLTARAHSTPLQIVAGGGGHSSSSAGGGAGQLGSSFDRAVAAAAAAVAADAEAAEAAAGQSSLGMPSTVSTTTSMPSMKRGTSLQHTGFGGGSAMEQLFQARAEAATAQAQVTILQDALTKERQEMQQLREQLTRMTVERDTLLQTEVWRRGGTAAGSIAAGMSRRGSAPGPAWAGWQAAGYGAAEDTATAGVAGDGAEPGTAAAAAGGLDHFGHAAAWAAGPAGYGAGPDTEVPPVRAAGFGAPERLGLLRAATRRASCGEATATSRPGPVADQAAAAVPLAEPELISLGGGTAARGSAEGLVLSGPPAPPAEAVAFPTRQQPLGTRGSRGSRLPLQQVPEAELTFAPAAGGNPPLAAPRVKPPFAVPGGKLPPPALGAFGAYMPPPIGGNPELVTASGMLEGLFQLDLSGTPRFAGQQAKQQQAAEGPLGSPVNEIPLEEAGIKSQHDERPKDMASPFGGFSPFA
ncbi:hypothetical protein N2152v2_000936 [Parachlorella kessleri]